MDCITKEEVSRRASFPFLSSSVHLLTDTQRENTNDIQELHTQPRWSDPKQLRITIGISRKCPEMASSWLLDNYLSRLKGGNRVKGLRISNTYVDLSFVVSD